jgi:signal transduction histidine kinase
MGVMLEIGRLRQDARRRAVLEERQRLARDLHDSVTQLLYGLTLFSRAGREAAEDGDEARLRQCLVDVERHSVSALGEMRLLLFELRPADLELAGLSQALRMRLEAVERRSGLQIEVQIDDLDALPSEYEVELYHIFIEAMNNVVKHAEARRIAVSLRCAQRDLHLQIADDGRGFDSAATGGGQGLQSMRERARSLGGRLVIAGGSGTGTRVEAVIPLPEEASPCRDSSGS